MKLAAVTLVGLSAVLLASWVFFLREGAEEAAQVSTEEAHSIGTAAIDGGEAGIREAAAHDLSGPPQSHAAAGAGGRAVDRVELSSTSTDDSAQATSAVSTSTTEEWTVSFSPLDACPSGSLIRISGVVAQPAADPRTWDVPIVSGQVPQLRLPAGSYVAALFEANAGLGPLMNFAVVDENVAVKLDNWAPFDVTFELRNAYTDEPVPGGRATLEAAGGTRAWHNDRVRTAVADQAGLVRLGTVQPGDWKLTAEADGFGSNDRDFKLPGPWAPGIERPETVDLMWFPVPPVTPLLVQLVGGTDWDDLTAFRISHTHEGEKIAFDQAGRATLELGWFNEPLYLKLWYPDERAAIMYLEEGLPEEGEPHLIHIGGEQRLEIDLRFAPGFEQSIAEFDSAAIRVSFQPETGDAMFVGTETFKEGVFTFDSVQAKDAVVNFATSNPGGGAVDWKTQWVTMKEEGTTSCTLLVDQRPIALAFLDSADQAVPSYHFEIRQLPNTTSWMGGGTSDALGESRMARIIGRPCVLVGWTGDPIRFQAYDLPLEFPTQGERLNVRVGDTDTTRIEVQVAGRPQEGVSLQLRTGVTDLWMDDVMTNENGQAPSIDLVRGSQLDVELTDEQYWTSERRVRVQPGLTVLHCSPTGHLTFANKDGASRVRVEGSDETIGDWIAAGKTSWANPEVGVTSVRVPAGTYAVDPGEPGERKIVLPPASVIAAGL